MDVHAITIVQIEAEEIEIVAGLAASPPPVTDGGYR